MQNVRGGTITKGEALRLMTPSGAIVDANRFTATCARSGDKLTVIGSECAEWWLGVKADHFEWQDRRAAMKALNND